MHVEDGEKVRQRRCMVAMVPRQHKVDKAHEVHFVLAPGVAVADAAPAALPHRLLEHAVDEEARHGALQGGTGIKEVCLAAG